MKELRIIENIFYTEGKRLSFEQAKTKALLFYSTIRDLSGIYDYLLDDYWYGIADNWDLNVWHDHEYRYLTLYKVNNFETNTDEFIQIYKEVI